MKKTLSMRKLADPRETEMFEKCDLADAVERLQIKDRQNELDKVTGFNKLMPLLRPKWLIGMGIFLTLVAQVRSLSLGFFMGQFIAILSVPFDKAILEKIYPNSNGGTAQDIVQYEVTLFCILLIAINFIGNFSQSVGR